ncbi:ankyrin repeat family protein [Orientia chuto str. Dubai]|uniref:Ankyrin repeat family protein n=1 Tax=Orientia chuto str. Dubai TaxID=1359168 RepID=A0A0F3MLN8_9RICK|nr:ankyrin repeat domain-containing protein [Candidatus Orientia mediorientalis]KJV56561.1 ankyrin repeat family protein [Orientia chuto str. Dubai]
MNNATLRSAAKHGNAAEVQRILLEGESIDINSVDEDGSTALHLAVYEGHTETVNILLAHGADPNLEDMYRRSSLITATIKGYNDVVHSLLVHGADVEQGGINGNTALHYASVRSVELVKTLVAHGANVNCQNTLWDTPLHLAAGYNKLKNVQYLLASGADTSLCNNVLCTPLRCMNHSDGENLEIVKLLVANIVKREACNQNVDLADKLLVDSVFADLKQGCLQEIQEMQAIIVKDELSLWDIFVAGNNKEEQKKYASMLDVTKCAQYRLYIDEDIVKSAVLHTALESMSKIFDPCSSPDAQPHLPYLPPEMKLMILENLSNEELIKMSQSEG